MEVLIRVDSGLLIIIPWALIVYLHQKPKQYTFNATNGSPSCRSINCDNSLEPNKAKPSIILNTW